MIFVSMVSVAISPCLAQSWPHAYTVHPEEGWSASWWDQLHSWEGSGQTRTSPRTHARAHTQTQTHTCIHTHKYNTCTTHTLTHTHTCTHTCTHTHTLTLILSAAISFLYDAIYERSVSPSKKKLMTVLRNSPLLKSILNNIHCLKQSLSPTLYLTHASADGAPFFLIRIRSVL